MDVGDSGAEDHWLGGGSYLSLMQLQNVFVSTSVTASLSAFVVPLVSKSVPILLAGPPGSGKTLFIEYLISTLQDRGWAYVLCL